MSLDYVIALAVSLLISWLLTRARARKPVSATEVETGAEQQFERLPAALAERLSRDAPPPQAPEPFGQVPAEGPRVARWAPQPSAPRREYEPHARTALRSGILPGDAPGLRRVLLAAAILGRPRALEPYDS